MGLISSKYVKYKKKQFFSFILKDDPDLDGDFVVINNSALELGHVLIIPQLNSGLNQVLTAEAVKLATEFVCLSGSENIIMGFNSIGAFSSVNHLHVQAYYLNTPFFPVRDPLPIHNANKAHSLGNRLWFLDDTDCYFMNTFALQLCDFNDDIAMFSEYFF
jgi:hypothetical protein